MVSVHAKHCGKYICVLSHLRSENSTLLGPLLKGGNWSWLSGKDPDIGETMPGMQSWLAAQRARTTASKIIARVLLLDKSRGGLLAPALLLQKLARAPKLIRRVTDSLLKKNYLFLFF